MPTFDASRNADTITVTLYGPNPSRTRAQAATAQLLQPGEQAHSFTDLRSDSRHYFFLVSRPAPPRNSERFTARPNAFTLRRTITQEVTMSPAEVAEYLGLPEAPDPATADLQALLDRFNDDTEGEDALFDADLSDATGNDLDVLPAFIPLPADTNQ